MTFFLSVARNLMRKIGFYIIFSALLFAIKVAVLPIGNILGFGQHISIIFAVESVIHFTFWLFVFVTLNCLLDFSVWRGIARLKSGETVPKLLIDIVSFIIICIGLVIGLNQAFGIEIVGLVTTSGIVIAIIGFALRGMISDIFTGIALNIERPLKKGDWIELNDGSIGQVQEINWRATRLLTREKVTIVVSNNFLASTSFKNFSTPTEYFRDKFAITFDYSINYEKAERVLLSGIAQVIESTNIPEKPEVRIMDFDEIGVKWECRYWVPNYEKLSSVRYEVRKRVLNNLIYAGMIPSRPKLEFFDTNYLQNEQSILSDEILLLKAMVIFEKLTDQQIQKIAEQLLPTSVKKGETIVSQGKVDNKSLYLVKEGFLEVFVDTEHDKNMKVGWLSPGMYFGEKSLLSDEPRSATVKVAVDAVLYEIKREDIKSLMQDEKDVAINLSRTMARREAENLDKISEANKKQNKQIEITLAKKIFKKMQSIFAL